MKRTIAITVLGIIMVGLTSYSYACLNDGTKPRCYCDIAFVSVSATDNEAKINIASVFAQITSEGKTLDVCIKNAYPGYEAYVTFTIKNRGSLPIRIDEVSATEYNKEALQVKTTGLPVSTLIRPGDTVGASETVRILEGAKQGWRYTFKVEIEGSCQAPEYPRSVGFWKNEFCVALDKNGESHLSPSELENYLDQVSRQSQVFKFTGTQKQKFAQAIGILQPQSSSSMEAKLKQQLLALWLNQVAGWTTGCSLGGTTSQQIIKGSENALVAHRTSQYEYWKNFCERFNNLGEN
jgi:hypothetical protein